MYTCAYDDDLAEIVKLAAARDDRSIKGQFTFYLKKALRDEGLLEIPDNKKADCTRQSNQSASVQP
ncbi:ParD-like family protein [Acinetobacter bereziniae]|uniref:ParD-like family protein n=1 Tax=Acinetobacter bereziniae TaxID=106648 RepID=UPI0021E500D1|nr:ParD-like family protein [Acinetobacter bereziniae]MCV2445528.1 ParD-like family protein [Acinetobacter bereziniae]